MALKFIQHFCSIASATIHAGGNTAKFGLGPTAVLLKQQKGWTYGGLVNHTWSVAGEGGRDDVNATFLQPFLSYTTKTFTTFGLNTEFTYDWENSEWTVPLVGQVSQLVKLASSRCSLRSARSITPRNPTADPSEPALCRHVPFPEMTEETNC